MRHHHADLIIAWAEGAEIETEIDNGSGKWMKSPFPNWYPECNYRIKSKEPEWFENIPEHGVLCWVSDIVKEPNKTNLLRFIYRLDKLGRYIGENGSNWDYATPLTNDEIKQFLRGDK